jgi:TRAP-type C4-dicarboxylate transport system permease small subunit
MCLKKLQDLISRITDLIVGLLKGIAMSVLVIMMLLTALDVIFRYIFNRPIAGSIELVEFMMAIMVSFGIAYCAVLRGHVSVDIVVTLLPEKTQTIIGTITSLLSLGLFLLITWQNLLYIKEIFESGLESPVLLIPVYPFIGVVAIGFAALCLVLLMDFFQLLTEAAKK